MTSIVGKVIGQLHMHDKVQKANAAKDYHRDRSDSRFPFGKEVTIIAVTKDRVHWWKDDNLGGIGFSGIILGPKFTPDGSINNSVIGIGTYNEILDFQIDPNAAPEEAHATLIFDNHNDFAEYEGWRK